MTLINIDSEREFHDYTTFNASYTLRPSPRGIPIWLHAETMAFPVRQVWSVLDIDGDRYAIPGYAVLNVVGYVVTQIGWTHENIEVRFS